MCDVISSSPSMLSVSVRQIFWMIGSMLIILLGMLVVPTLGWRWMIRISVTPSIILIFLFKVRCLTHLSVLTVCLWVCLSSPVCLFSPVSLFSLFLSRLVITYQQEIFRLLLLLWRKSLK